MGTSPSGYPPTSEIPIDLFVSKKHPGVTRGNLGFADSSGDIVFRVNRHSPKSSPNNENKRILLLGSTGNPLLSLYRYHNGCWNCYEGDNNGEKELVFRVQRSLKTLTRIELEVFLVGENSDDSTCALKVKGSPFQRSCTIYKGNAIVAQTSLMYKLNQIFVKRGNV
ncbi:Protein LURP-one-related like [Quillaja saponaria]|uniref:Protein LURP-one-related like n=1 Tax=Quillaja saponaria TaxID=32244 RepID=A0AAD7PK39_QUISA|nr:Protein LURP-one-related like [Quillaja saponaria]